MTLDAFALLLIDVMLHLHVLKVLLVTLLLHLLEAPIHALLVLVKQLSYLLKLINYLQLFWVLFIFVQLLVVLEVLEVRPQHANTIEQVRLEVEIVLFAQPQLVVIVIEALLGQSNHLGRLLQTHLLEMVLALVDLPPSLHDFYHLEDHPLLAALFLMRGRLGFLLWFVVGGDGARVAGDLRDIGHCDFDDYEVGGMQIAEREEVARRSEGREGLACEIVDFDDFGGEVRHEVGEELPEGKFVIEKGQLQRKDFDLLTALIFDDQRLEDLRSKENRKH